MTNSPIPTQLDLTRGERRDWSISQAECASYEPYFLWIVAEQVRTHVLEVRERTRGVPGFVMSTPGGIHGNLPLENLVAYFDARVQTGHTPAGWQKHDQEGGRT